MSDDITSESLKEIFTSRVGRKKVFVEMLEGEFKPPALFRVIEKNGRVWQLGQRIEDESDNSLKNIHAKLKVIDAATVVGMFSTEDGDISVFLSPVPGTSLADRNFWFEKHIIADDIVDVYYVCHPNAAKAAIISLQHKEMEDYLFLHEVLKPKEEKEPDDEPSEGEETEGEEDLWLQLL